jgi:phage terminase small subunit
VKGADEFADAVEAYERAQADALFVRGMWIAEGRPLVQQSTNGLLGRHPLWRVMLEAEAHAARFRSELGLTPKSAKAAIRRGPGRPPGAASSPDRLRLRSVE